MVEHTSVYTVGGISEARIKIEELERQGYLEENIYVLTHDKERTAHVAEQTVGHEIGIAEEGIITATANLFRSTGNELRAKLRSMGVSKENAEHLESEMDKGMIVILSHKSSVIYDGDSYDPHIAYYGYVPMK